MTDILSRSRAHRLPGARGPVESNQTSLLQEAQGAGQGLPASAGGRGGPQERCLSILQAPIDQPEEHLIEAPPGR